MNKGKDAFLDHYRTLFQNASEFESWLKALSTPNLPILRFAASNEKKLRQQWTKHGLTWTPLFWHPQAILWPKECEKGTVLPGYDDGLLYPMNASSLLPVLALDPQPGETILDACAAPGGKAVFIADQMKGKGTLIANDRSPDRRNRLKKIVIKYGHADHAQIMGNNAATLFRSHPHHFDKILLDAPCSSEKHVWATPTELARWSPGRIRQIKTDQWALLNGLARALKPGGILVYSTCAVTPEENEHLVEKFLKKHPEFHPIPLDRQWPHEQGRVHPHRHSGMDPMFVAKLQKSASAETTEAPMDRAKTLASSRGTKRSSHRRSLGKPPRKPVRRYR